MLMINSKTITQENSLRSKVMHLLNLTTRQLHIYIPTLIDYLRNNYNNILSLNLVDFLCFFFYIIKM